LGQYPEAEQQARKALQCDPQNSYALAHLGSALLHQGHAAEAAAKLEQALALNPALDAARKDLETARGQVK